MPWNSALRDAFADRDAARRGLTAALAERDIARTDRDTARGERDAARAERDAFHEALTSSLAEGDSARHALVKARPDPEGTRKAALSNTEEFDRLVLELRNLSSRQVATDRRLQFLHRELMTDIQALDQLMARFAPHARLPAVGGWALGPAGLLALVDLIETRDARTVVECGSGTSTLWAAYALKRLGRGKVIALEHLPEYAAKTRAIVAAHGLDEFVDVRLVPLAPRATPRGLFPWYSFDPAEIDEPIDLLLVDGPPQSTGRHARYPALSVFRPYLARGALIIADDTDRPDEIEMIEWWMQEEARLGPAESPGRGIEILELTP